MQSLLHILLTNAAVAAAMAGVVMAVGVVCRKPAGMRGLWVLVFLKMLGPPVVTFQVQRLLPQHRAPVAVSRAAIEEPPLLEIPADATEETPVARPGKLSIFAPRMSIATRLLQRAPTVWAAGSAVL